VPTLPQTDGLPVWAQILVSILICVGTLGVAFKGYFGSKLAGNRSDQTTAVSLAAVLGDLAAIRHLSDVVVQLNANVLALVNCINEATHHERNNVEALEELCSRVRRLTEALDRFHQP
jgi:hypothetical protein